MSSRFFGIPRRPVPTGRRTNTSDWTANDQRRLWRGFCGALPLGLLIWTLIILMLYLYMS